MMKLTNAQIQYIENRLKKEGVKYWDIRIELLDHVVSDVESKLQDVDDFKKIVQNSFVSLGWTNWSKFKTIVAERSVLVNKKYRKMYFQEFVIFFKSIKNITVYSIFLCVYAYLFFHLNFKIFHKVSFGILAITFLIPIYNVIKFYNRLHRKSLLINQGGFYLMFSFSILGLVSPFINSDSIINASLKTKEIILMIYLSIHIVGLYAGYKTYIKAKNEVKKMYKELQKL